jgi:hypothetical protein
MDGIQINQAESKGKRGGARRGAGREPISRKMLRDPRYLAARGVNPLMAGQILSQVVDERRVWQRIFNSEDDRVVLQAIQFLMSMRDGKPAQQINVTSTSLQLNQSDLERARAIVREIRGDIPSLALAQPQPNPESTAPNHESNLGSSAYSGLVDEGRAESSSPLQADANLSTGKGELRERERLRLGMGVEGRDDEPEAKIKSALSEE